LVIWKADAPLVGLVAFHVLAATHPMPADSIRLDPVVARLRGPGRHHHGDAARGI
jgi:hypothetical protein